MFAVLRFFLNHSKIMLVTPKIMQRPHTYPNELLKEINHIHKPLSLRDYLLTNKKWVS